MAGFMDLEMREFWIRVRDQGQVALAPRRRVAASMPVRARVQEGDLSDSGDEAAPVPAKAATAKVPTPAGTAKAVGKVVAKRATSVRAKMPTPAGDVVARMGEEKAAPAGPVGIFEIFAGSGNLSAAFRRHGLMTHEFDLKLSARHDMSKPTSVNNFLQLVQQHNAAYVHMAPPCNTFSRARYPVIRRRVSCEVHVLGFRV